jgi:putative salt-induced outer membrane protein YdiY
MLPSGETVKGKIATAGDQLQIAAGTGATMAPLAKVASVRNAGEQHNFERLLHPGILDLWNGNFDIEIALARGNARTESLTTAFTAGRNTRTDKITLYFNQIYSTARVNDVNSTSASAVRGGWKYNRNVSPRMFVTGFNDYEHDGFQNLKVRLVAGAGAGVRAMKSERAQLDFDGGGDYQRENFLKGLHRNSAEVNFGDNLLYTVSKATSVTQSMRVFTNLTETGSYRLNFDIGANTVLKKWLGWHVTASDRFLSNPVQGRQRNDLLISTGFRLSFAK